MSPGLNNTTCTSQLESVHPSSPESLFSSLTSQIVQKGKREKKKILVRISSKIINKHIISFLFRLSTKNYEMKWKKKKKAPARSRGAT